METILTRNLEVAGLIPGLTQWAKDQWIALSRGVGHRRGSDLALLWFWHRPAATALIRPLAWEPPYASGTFLKGQKTKKKKRKIQRISSESGYSLYSTLENYVGFQTAKGEF